MKIAITGKGGVGKTTLAAGLATFFSRKGRKVFAIDADPDANLALTLGFPEPSRIKPLIQMKQLIEERTGAKIGTLNPYFKLNPRVDDIPDKYFARHKGINLMVMGTVRGGGLGCACPENAFLKALLGHLILEREEVVILDMEAGIEHLGRGTARGVNEMIIVVEPGSRSIETAFRIKELAKDIGIKNIDIVGNKIRHNSDKEFLKVHMPHFNFLGFIRYDEKILEADLNNTSPFETNTKLMEEVENIAGKITKD
ncbi:AAA family ATPase [Candidatus Aerophobetes bacterium]|nr:AAA family ATPase [Candidatus Aerophobetes bacterium]